AKLKQLKELLDMGAITKEDFEAKKAELLKQKISPISIFYCPSRRFAENTYGPEASVNAAQPADNLLAKTDYAVSGGTSVVSFYAGPSLDCLDKYPNCNWGPFTPQNIAANWNGPSMPRYPVPVSLIEDGASHTLLLGEKFLRPDLYSIAGGVTINSCSDNNSLFQGYDWDTTRWTNRHPAYLPLPDNAQPTPQNNIGSACSTRFGSPHSGAFNVAFCDGSVRSLQYSIDGIVWERLGARNDGESVEIPQ
ncbi:MAG: DUF1559 domain-containing protein, partial [Planctomycetales bacterium]|nr:DUF1559 domain-containing protein [Planctomycetales bacterium]